jgi:hypothetical protein
MEAKHILFIKLLFPMVLGVMEGDKPSTTHPINAAQLFQVWNPQNNYDGVKLWIKQGLDNLNLQIGTAI